MRAVGCARSTPPLGGRKDPWRRSALRVRLGGGAGSTGGIVAPMRFTDAPARRSPGRGSGRGRRRVGHDAGSGPLPLSDQASSMCSGNVVVRPYDEPMSGPAPTPRYTYAPSTSRASTTPTASASGSGSTARQLRGSRSRFIAACSATSSRRAPCSGCRSAPGRFTIEPARLGASVLIGDISAEQLGRTPTSSPRPAWRTRSSRGSYLTSPTYPASPTRASTPSCATAAELRLGTGRRGGM